MRPNSRWALAVLFSLTLAAGASAQAGKEDYERYRTLIDRYVADAEEIEGLIKGRIEAQGIDGRGKPIDVDANLGGMYGVRTRKANLVAERGRLETGWQELVKGDRTLPDFEWKAYQQVMEACGEIASVQFQECYYGKWLIQQKQYNETRLMWEEFQREDGELKTRFADDQAKCDAARADLVKKYTDREEVVHQEALRQYETITHRLMDRRRALCGDLWRLSDYSERRDRPVLAKEFRDKAYRCWGFGPADAIEEGPGPWLSREIRYTNHEDQMDWVQFRFGFLKNVPDLEMDDVVAAVPVETLRQFDTTLPAVESSNNKLEGMCVVLAARLQRFFTVLARQEALHRELRLLADGIADLPRAGLDAEPLRKAIESWQEQKQLFDQASEKARVSRANLAERESVLANAVEALAAARRDLQLNRETLRPAAGPANAGERPAEEILRDKKRAVEASEDMLKDSTIDAETRKRIQEVALPRQREELTAVEKAIESALHDRQAAVDAATAGRDRAKAESAAAPDANDVHVVETWIAVSTEATAARLGLPARLRASMPAIGASTDEKAAEKATANLKGLRESIAALDLQRSNLRRDLLDRMGQLRRCESELGLLSPSIAGIRKSAAILAEETLRELGAGEKDEVLDELKRLSEKMEQIKKLTESTEAGFDKLEWLRSHLVQGEEGARIIEGAKGRLETVTSVLEFLGTQAERIQKLKETRDQLQDPHTALQAMSTFLDAVGSVSDSVPVIGPILGDAIGYYASTAAACGTAINDIQSKLIEQDFHVLVEHRPPEMHLYTEAEVTAGCSREFAEGPCRRIAKMCQVRRLIALTKATRLSEVRDGN